MAISTNSIIHYTDSFDVLKLILKEGFKIKYCVERLVTKGGTGKTNAAHPMVSFCDIPLSESHKHFGAYGKYGIGLSKRWAAENGVNPVLYIEKSSAIGLSIKEQFHNYSKGLEVFSKSQESHLVWLKSHTKNYSGHLKRKEIDDPNYKFYDEREWRYVPDKSIINNHPISIRETEFNENKDWYNEAIGHARLCFYFSDVSYLIVKDDKEIAAMITFLRSEYHSQLTGAELDILFSKVCSVEQILNDY